jgi:hypothetical protein
MSGFCVLVLSGTTVVENLDNQIHFGWPYIRSMDQKGNNFEEFGKHFTYKEYITTCTVLNSRVHLPSSVADVLTHLLFGFLSLYSWALKLWSVSDTVREESDTSSSVSVSASAAMLICVHGFFLCSIGFLVVVLTNLLGWTFFPSNCHFPPLPWPTGMNTGPLVILLPELDSFHS